MKERKHKLNFNFEYKTVTLNYPTAEGKTYLKYCFDTDSEEYIKLYNYFHEMDCVCDIDTDVGMTDVVFYINFKYDTPDETIRGLLKSAIKMVEDIMNKAQMIIDNLRHRGVTKYDIADEIEFREENGTLRDEKCFGYMTEELKLALGSWDNYNI